MIEFSWWHTANQFFFFYMFLKETIKRNGKSDWLNYWNGRDYKRNKGPTQTIFRMELQSNKARSPVNCEDNYCILPKNFIIHPFKKKTFYLLSFFLRLWLMEGTKMPLIYIWRAIANTSVHGTRKKTPMASQLQSWSYECTGKLSTYVQTFNLHSPSRTLLETHVL